MREIPSYGPRELAEPVPASRSVLDATLKSLRTIYGKKEFSGEFVANIESHLAFVEYYYCCLPAIPPKQPRRKKR